MNQKGIGPANKCLQSKVKLFIKIYTYRVCFSQVKKDEEINRLCQEKTECSIFATLAFRSKDKQEIGIEFCVCELRTEEQ